MGRGELRSPGNSKPCYLIPERRANAVRPYSPWQSKGRALRVRMAPGRAGGTPALPGTPKPAIRF
ncbi:hypothetical protein AGMMS50256_35240 [Betaproteobacteria bacterium]|nr:hypothetical protein AGMMS50256_35240 [Betaproteobacteria bacterium]